MNSKIIKIKAKKLLSYSKNPDPWFGIKYGMNIYRGCQHRCIYCDSRSECYQIANFNNVEVKENAIELLRKEIMSKRVKGTIGTGGMNDPYTPLEKKTKLIRGALKVIRDSNFPVHIVTKSSLVTRDVDILKDISRVYAAVSFTITTTDDELAKKIEPGASLPSERLKAMKILSDAGIYTGITMMPILPFIEDNEENIIDIVEKGASSGAKYIIASFGMTLRDRQRVYYYNKLDELFPGFRQKYQAKYGNNYGCAANNVKLLKEIFKQKCKENNIDTRIKMFYEDKSVQLSLFE